MVRISRSSSLSSPPLLASLDGSVSGYTREDAGGGLPGVGVSLSYVDKDTQVKGS